MKAVEILSLGDELLRGVVQDSNSYWMAQTPRRARREPHPDPCPSRRTARVAEELHRAFAPRAGLS